MRCNVCDHFADLAVAGPRGRGGRRTRGVLLAMLLTAAGCDSDNRTVYVIFRTATPTPTAIPSPTPVAATATPTLAATPTPTATSSPTRVPPTATPTLAATRTPIATPSPTPAVTATPKATPTLAPGACLPSSSLSVLISGTNVTAYVPDGNWGPSSVNNIEVVPIETKSGIGTGGSPTTITTAEPINSCSSNSATGQTVCVANDTSVFLIEGTSIKSTLTSGATGTEAFSGGSCMNCGVVVDSTQNKALITVGLSSGGGGYQFLDLGASPPTFETPIPAGPPTPPATATSEDALIDPIRHLVLSPNEGGDYQILDISGGTGKAKLFDNDLTLPAGGEPDSAGEDCTTGIALSTVEFVKGDLFIADLTQATFDTTKMTWSDTASQIQNFPEFDSLSFGTCGIAVAPGTHFAIVAGEFGGNVEGVIQLPATSGSGTPAVVDWVSFTVPADPNGNAFSLGFDPHTTTAYISPNSGKALGVMTGTEPDRTTPPVTASPPTFLVVADLEGLLKAPRTGHVVNTPLPAGLITFVNVK
jgi:hypothetical protein